MDRRATISPYSRFVLPVIANCATQITRPNTWHTSIEGIAAGRVRESTVADR